MKFLFFFIILFFGAFHLQAQNAAVVVPSPSADSHAVWPATFDKVWNTINEKHYDPTFGGVDWKKARASYQPKAMSAKTDAEFHGVLNDMLRELKLSHFGVLPRAVDLQAAQDGRGIAGIDIKMLDGRPVIDRVAAGSSAFSSGVKPGFILTAVGGKKVAELIKPLEDSLTGRPLSDGMRKIYFERTIEAFINGKAGTSVKLDVLNARDQPQVFNIARQVFSGEMSQAMGNFPPQEVIFESKRLENNIGYIRFNMWVIPQMPKIRAAIREFADAKGIVFDLRGNPGGVGGMASGIAGLLTSERASLGSMTTRDSVMKFVVFPQSEPFMGKVVILQDHGSASTSEVFAAGMQELARAAIIGTTSAGAVLPSVFEKLPTGALFQYAISDYRSPKNILIEGRGVVPDIDVSQTRKARLAGGDAQLDSAVKFILN